MFSALLRHLHRLRCKTCRDLPQVEWSSTFGGHFITPARQEEYWKLTSSPDTEPEEETQPGSKGY